MNNKKTLLYNIINLDFILLETSAHKISNFFLEKIKRKKNYIIRLVTSDVVKLFKKFLKLFNFIKKFKQLSYSFIYIWLGSDFLFEFFKFFFHKYKLQCILNYSLFFPKFEKYRSLQSSIVIDQFLTQKEFFYYFYNNFYDNLLLQRISQTFLLQLLLAYRKLYYHLILLLYFLLLSFVLHLYRK